MNYLFLLHKVAKMKKGTGTFITTVTKGSTNIVNISKIYIQQNTFRYSFDL